MVDKSLQLTQPLFTAMRIYHAQGEHKASLADGLYYMVQLSYSKYITMMFYATAVGKWVFGSPRMMINLDPFKWSVSPLASQQRASESLESKTAGSPHTLQLAKLWLQHHGWCL
jgi:hypothetical protein